MSDRKGLAALVHAMALTAPGHPQVGCGLLAPAPQKGDDDETKVHRPRSGDLQDVWGSITLSGQPGPRPERTRRDDLVRMYREAVVYVQLSHYEGLPTSFLEAVACGRPRVATEVSGHRDAIRDGLSGLLAPRPDQSSLARGIGRYVIDALFAERIGREGRTTILQRFTREALARVHEGAYERARATWAKQRPRADRVW